MITNLERIGKMISIHGPDSVNIHTVPMSPYWIVMYMTEKTKPNFRVIICNPELTTYRLVTEHVTPENYLKLWNALTKIELSPHLKDTCEELKKCASNYTNKYKNICKQTTQILLLHHGQQHETSYESKKSQTYTDSLQTKKLKSQTLRLDEKKSSHVKTKKSKSLKKK